MLDVITLHEKLLFATILVLHTIKNLQPYNLQNIWLNLYN
jgi:hypothetical protein